MNAPVETQLHGMPELEPPVDAWRRIEKRACHERRVMRWRQLSPVALAGGLLLTAAALVLTVFANAGQEPAMPATEAEPLLVETVLPELDSLQGQSRALEAMLRDLPGRPQLVRADDAAAISALEDRIAQLDWALNRASARPDARVAEPVLWSERVGLMGELVRARYTEAGVAAY